MNVKPKQLVSASALALALAATGCASAASASTTTTAAPSRNTHRSACTTTGKFIAQLLVITGSGTIRLG